MFHWTVHLNGSPKEEYLDCAVAVRYKVYHFGGRSNMNMDQIGVHVFNTVSLRWVKVPPVPPGRGEPPLEAPCSRSGHTAVLIEEIIYIWGGGRPYCNVLYGFSVDAHRWFKPQVSGTVPPGRNHHSACVLGKVMFIHGGCNQCDMYKLDTTTMVWSLINTRGTLVPASSKHSATIIGTKMFVFGGYRGYTFRPVYIRVFDTETNCWLDTPSSQLLPEGRMSHSAFAHNGELYIFGGYSSTSNCLNDLWKHNPESFSWKKVEAKGNGPCPMCDMCCSMVGDRIILIGGYKGTVTDDLYVLDLSPSLKTLCKLAVIQYGLEESELPHNVRWELAAMTIKKTRQGLITA